PEGGKFEPPHHDYARDLDIFGKASLYQYTNRTVSQQGNQLFASWLLSPADNKTLLMRQSALKELSIQPAWRQQLQAYGMEDGIRQETEEKIHGWMNKENRFVQKQYWKILQFLLPLAALLSLLLHITGILDAAWFYLALFVFFSASLYISKLVMPEYRLLNKIAAEVETLSHSIRHIEATQFESSLLKELKNRFQRGDKNSSALVRELKSILDRLDYRLNPLVFIPLNTFFFWDLQQVMALEKWKEKNKGLPEGWIAALAEMECLASLANLAFNHPHWCFPGFTEEQGIFISEELGHPLIEEDKRVSSNFSTQGPAQISLITGSNMAGKSTFLRSVGVNTVLAMAGGPVCAKKLLISNLRVISSMRVNDNLEESTSTFYAELKKLKYIIESVNRKEKVLLLLDEILRGTNSADRHTGSTALIRQLVQHGAVGLVATHDLELARLEQEHPSHIHNYHFDVQVENEELFFDYLLKKGVCTSMNASLLMKKIGIEL
ncbi:MAG TPA: hypothetical protein VFX58_14500, partial [Chitinophagaceae bacterium]|nr:hypothetical protein [Chitinophagaceae bacterium]